MNLKPREVEYLAESHVAIICEAGLFDTILLSLYLAFNHRTTLVE